MKCYKSCINFVPKIVRNGRVILLSGLIALLGACKSDDMTSSQQEKVLDSHEVKNQQAVSHPLSAMQSTSHEGTEYWRQFVRAYTHGSVSSQSDINIQFNHKVVEQLRAVPSDSNILQLTPPVSGLLRFSAPDALHFQPTQPLPAGQRIEARLAVNKLQGFPENSEDFVFSIDVKPQVFDVYVDGLVRSKQSAMMSMEGRIRFSDAVQTYQLSTFILANQDGQAKQVKWFDAEGAVTEHRFIINDITQQEQASKLVMQWQGAVVGSAQKGEYVFPVPAKNDFGILSIVNAKSHNPHVIITFSQNLKKNQSLKPYLKASWGEYKLTVDDNRLLVFPNKALNGTFQVEVLKGLQSKTGKRLAEGQRQTLVFAHVPPVLKFVDKGAILPPSAVVGVPFNATNLKSVQVTAFQVFPQNIPHYLQNYSLSDDYAQKHLGRYIWRKTVALDTAILDQEQQFQLDMTELTQKYPGALFHLELSANRGDSLYPCSASDNSQTLVKEAPVKNWSEKGVEEVSAWDGIESALNSEDNVPWHEYENPCHNAYYIHGQSTKTRQSLFVTNLGVIAKSNANNDLVFATSNIATGKRQAEVMIDVYNLQHQKLAHVVTDGQGLAEVTVAQKPFYLIARQGDDISYLRLSDAQALSTSHFDVSGQTVDGVKAYIYAERGVWRPGDNMYLNFIVQDLQQKIPDRHPVMLELFNPRGQRMQVLVNNQPVSGFYRFDLATADDAPTGNWKVLVTLGTKKFEKYLKVETVKPNHLSIKLKPSQEQFSADPKFFGGAHIPFTADLTSQWLHGAKASHLKTDIKVKLKPQKTHFATHQGFTFDDPIRRFKSSESTVFKGKLNADGYTKVSGGITVAEKSPGRLNGTLTTRVFEKSGDFSVSTQSVTLNPFTHYVGVKMPKGDHRGMLLTDESHEVDIVVMDVDGRPSTIDNVEVSLYQIEWKWWWEKTSHKLADFLSDSYTQLLQQETLQFDDTASNRAGQMKWSFQIDYPDWGRYLLRVCDKKGGHCTGKIFYLDWPGWAGKGQKSKSLGANVMTLTTEKTRYKVGDTAEVLLPEMADAELLVTVETGSRVLDKFWVSVSDQREKLNIPITSEMAPNAYITVTALQAHQDKANDRPIRMMGITPILVTDESTILEPELELDDEVKPETKMQVKVSEAQGKAMTYTLAIVDEGLLGLTNFSTPNPHHHFYQREALGIKTWDVFDDVIGRYGVNLAKLLAIGGDKALNKGKNEKRNDRFPPVVSMHGPFTLAAGQQAMHDIAIPQYLGAVRVMLVAGSQGAYGAAEKTVKVRQDLNVLTTLPRVLSVGDELQVPVTLFSTNEAIQDVQVSLEYLHSAATEGDQASLESTQLKFSQAGEQQVVLPLEVGTKAGHARVKVIAESVNPAFRTEQITHLEVRLPNQATRRQERDSLKQGETWQTEWQGHGLQGTNHAMLELSLGSRLNLQQRVDDLIRYPHGCVEQVTSTIFPQLVLNDLTHLDATQQERIQNHVSKALERLRSYQRHNGSFSYWPGQSDVNMWVNSYVGHMLLLAKSQGYQLPLAMLEQWLIQQNAVASTWVEGQVKQQAYRLYTLALAGQANLSAMNRLRDHTELHGISRWLLAAAYALAGQQQAAENLVENVTALSVVTKGSATDSTSPTPSTFDSEVRDLALALISQIALKHSVTDQEKTFQAVAAWLGSERWLSTHSSAMAILASASYFSAQQSRAPVTMKLSGLLNDVITLDKPIVQKRVPTDVLQTQTATGNTQLKLEYVKAGRDAESELGLPVELIWSSIGIPEAGKEQSAQEGLTLRVSYYDADGKPVQLQSIKQGTDIEIQVTVRNSLNKKQNYLALTLPIPAGWDILSQTTGNQQLTEQDLDYIDIRDDKQFAYFDLEAYESKTVTLKVNAAYLGQFYWPAIQTEAMYDGKVFARHAGQWVNVLP